MHAPGSSLDNIKAQRRLAAAGVTIALPSQPSGLLPQAVAAYNATDPQAHIDKAPLDPILGTKVKYDADTSPQKVNLGIGAYRTDDGKPYVLRCVSKAEQLIANDTKLNKEYLPQKGHVEMTALARTVLFGKDSKPLREGRIATVQTLSGTGALRIAAEYINKFFPKSTAYYSEPTWGNHKAIFSAAHVPHKAYRYWDAKGRRLDIEGMLEDIGKAPAGSVILLHACAHNPTGVDPTQEQWRRISSVMKSKGHFAFLDCAYQGFATGDLERDAWAIRHFAELGFTNLIVCQSFAKNFGLYSERVGTLNVVCGTKEQAEAVLSQLEVIIRANYSNPPAHGALIVHRVLSNPALYQEWLTEMTEMSSRIKKMRELLFNELKRQGTPGDWSHITSQIGMFSYTGLSEKQCELLIKKHHVYLLTNGRISMAGVNSSNVVYLARAIDDVVRNA